MAKYCNKECEGTGAVCDFCLFYDYSGTDLVIEGITYKGALYTGNGYCRLHKKQKDPGEGCNDFICYLMEKK